MALSGTYQQAEVPSCNSTTFFSLTLCLRFMRRRSGYNEEHYCAVTAASEHASCQIGIQRRHCELTSQVEHDSFSSGDKVIIAITHMHVWQGHRHDSNVVNLPPHTGISIQLHLK